MAYDFWNSGNYQYDPNTPLPPSAQQQGQQKQGQQDPYALQHVPGITGGLNDMFRTAMSHNLMGKIGDAMQSQDPTMTALFSQPPATSSNTAIY